VFCCSYRYCTAYICHLIVDHVFFK
jgi:hypothetical protein